MHCRRRPLLRWIQIVALVACQWSLAHATTYTSFTTSGDWSDPRTWNLDAAPVLDPAGDVVVASGTSIYINANVTVASITVSRGGVLSCGRRGSSPVILTVAKVVVESGGCFTCTESSSAASDCSAAFSSGASSSTSLSFVPYAGPQFTLRLASTQAPATADDDVRTVLVKDGGALVLAGQVRGASAVVARLAEHAMAGAKEITVEGAGPFVASSTMPWAAGDTIAIGPTDYFPDQTEYFRVVSVRLSDSSANKGLAVLELDGVFKYSHSGKAYGLVHPTSIDPPNQTFVLDARAEVALLTRNIVIEGMSDDPDGLKGDVKIMGSAARAYISWAAFKDLGRRGQLGRYPLHFHGVGAGGANVDVRNVAVYRSSQRGIVVHCTSGANFADNVVADVEGFAYMLEDGAEEGNVFTNNLALDVRAPDASTNNASLLTERENPAGFWFLNAANTFVGNVAAGVRGSGFALDLDPKMISRPSTYTVCPEQVPGFDVSLLDKGSKNPALLGMSVYRALAAKPFTRFENNVAHAAHTGLWLTSLPQPDATLRIDSFTAWKIAPRQGSSSKIAFDACVRASGVLGMRLNRLACANTALTYWSTESAFVTNTVMAWLRDGRSVEDQAPQIVPSGAKWQPQWAKHNGLASYLSAQTFLATYAYGNFPSGPSSSDFVAAASGSLTGAHNLIAGFRRDAAATSTTPVLALDSRMQQAYLDLTGEVFGRGAGVRALCSCPGCGVDAVDPLIAAYTPVGQCAVLQKNINAASVPPTTPKITCAGAVPLECKPVAELPAPTFVTVEIQGVYRPGRLSNQAMRAQGPFAANASSAASRSVAPNQNAIGTSMWRFLAPMTRASADEFNGGYRVGNEMDWTSLSSLTAIVGPTSDSQGALTIVISRVPDSVILYADMYPWPDLPRSSVRAAASRIDVANGTALDPRSCPELLQGGCKAPEPCVCQSPIGRGLVDIYIRFRAWGEIYTPILNDKAEPYLYKLAKFQIRLQLVPLNQAPATPPNDLFASLYTALQNAPV